MNIKVGSAEARTHHPQNIMLNTRSSMYLIVGARIVKYNGIGKIVTFRFLRFPFVVYIPHTVNWLVTDIILNITSQEHLMFTLLHNGSGLFELYSKEVCVKKQPGMHVLFHNQCV